MRMTALWGQGQVPLEQVVVKYQPEYSESFTAPVYFSFLPAKEPSQGKKQWYDFCLTLP